MCGSSWFSDHFWPFASFSNLAIGKMVFSAAGAKTAAMLLCVRHFRREFQELICGSSWFSNLSASFGNLATRWLLVQMVPKSRLLLRNDRSRSFKKSTMNLTWPRWQPSPRWIYLIISRFPTLPCFFFGSCYCWGWSNQALLWGTLWEVRVQQPCAFAASRSFACMMCFQKSIGGKRNWSRISRDSMECDAWKMWQEIEALALWPNEPIYFC